MTLSINPFYILTNLDKYLATIISLYGPATYIILFLIVLLETGLVIMPFLPGDSLIFTAGIFASSGLLSLPWLFLIFVTAAILGDSLNYYLGSYFGEKIFIKHNIIKKEKIEKTKQFFHKYGGKTIIYARFLPIVRSFAPFVAGIGKMNYKDFLFFNITGAILWVSSFLLSGFFLGNIKFVQTYLSEIIILIIVLSILPPLIEYIHHLHSKKKKIKV